MIGNVLAEISDDGWEAGVWIVGFLSVAACYITYRLTGGDSSIHARRRSSDVHPEEGEEETGRGGTGVR